MGTFYLGLALIVLGTGFLKPCISTLVGQLYGKDDPRRDAGFSIYYMGINIGAFIAPFICGFLAQHKWFQDFLVSIGLSSKTSWHFGFAAAAVGMGFGLVQYVYGLRHLGDAGKKPSPPADPREASRNRKILAGIVAAFLGLPALVAVLGVTGVVEVSAARLGNWQGVVLLLLSVAVFGGLFLSKRFTRDERNRLLVVLLLFFGAAVFFACFEQAATTMSLFAERNTRNSVFGFEFPSSWWQSVNAACVVIFAGVFAWLWLRLGKRDPSAPMKFGIAMVLLTVSFLWLATPARDIAANGPLTKVSPVWLFGVYLIQTWSELCLSPVGLSSMTKLAPSSIGGMIMGIWFLGASIGNWGAGKVASYYEQIPLEKIFLYLAIVPAIVAVLFFALVRPINRMLARAPAEPEAA
jgi:POT family proton-dependent oligopeptide transporter